MTYPDRCYCIIIEVWDGARHLESRTVTEVCTLPQIIKAAVVVMRLFGQQYMRADDARLNISMRSTRP